MGCKFFWPLALTVCLLQPAAAAAGGENLESLFQAAQSKPSQRRYFIATFTVRRGLPEHVLRVDYSPELGQLARTNPLRQYRSGKYGLTDSSRSIGQGYPSVVTFGPRLFHRCFNLVDFESVLQHEAAHARFWATGKLNHLDEVDTDEVRSFKGVLPIVFELDAIRTQMEYSSWQDTSAAFRKGQESYREKWLQELAGLREEYSRTNIAPLLDRLWRAYSHVN